MDDYMKKYCERMDKVTLSDTADQEILGDLLKDNAWEGVPYMKRTKRNISAAVAAVIIAIISATTVFAGVAIRGIIIKSNKAESQEKGDMTTVDVGESYYYDLLAGVEGELYTLTDNDYESALTDYHAVVWKSTDQGDTWETALFQPDELVEESFLLAGDLREGNDGIEAVVIMQEENDKAEDGYVNRVYHITADSYEEYDMDAVYTKLGDQNHLFNVKYVNDYIIALVGTEECLLYDTNTQEIVKSLPYDLTMGCLQTRDQFLIYGKEIYCCLDAETLNEQEPEEGLKEFVQTMYVKNDNQVFPPMTAWNDTIVCVTKAGIYEYKDGEIMLIRPFSNEVNNGNVFNGLLPICKARDGLYYVYSFRGSGMSLWEIDGDREEMK